MFSSGNLDKESQVIHEVALGLILLSVVWFILALVQVISIRTAFYFASAMLVIVAALEVFLADYLWGAVAFALAIWNLPAVQGLFSSRPL